jgi:hypothetical protein
MKPLPSEAIVELSNSLYQEPAFIAGSCVAAAEYQLDGYSDIDAFVPTEQVLMTITQKLLDQGYTMDEKFDRVWYRWQRYGLMGWHTNSMKLHSRSDVEVNIIYKTVNRQPVRTLAQVLESFDFGLLAIGFDVEHGVKRDMRSYLHPDVKPGGPYPLNPEVRSNWINGFISQHRGLRQAGRYARYVDYGYDMSATTDDLVVGYRAAALYHSNSFDEEKKFLFDIYTALANRIEDHEIGELLQFYKTLDFKSPLDEIMAALE